ncbi:probable 2-oxoglutarate-dependent dioxygenase AOP1 isoform X2 [Prosopis cineraria]|nr:probable 2-oxoglutarate-dependent dioxygenase AOP1 isoform X2 [Prosopis cineraria]XP_054779545.1 probable 2-oxoglutarate-dependent dioxygenase AOP1 isoform X2 [Prosopis cineraria]XP_054779546.1 probable 2-oxoglutarate-dependent dioxygenase AOP1 isoform X2 [Prosopis cineraria]
MGSLTVSQIPIIDFSDENMKPGTDTWFSASQVLRSAVESHGCFYAMTNEISMELFNSVFALMKELFDLPLETKNQKTSEKPNHGYYPRIPKAPLYESVGIDLDGSTNEEAIQMFANKMWPKGYDHFCEAINLYAKLLVEMDRTAKRLLFDAYGLDKRDCDSLLESTNYMFRSFKYLVPHKTQNTLGLYAHTDSSYFTIIHQNNVAGLQVKLKTGEWVDTDPSHCMFVFLAGDALKVWSNDRIQSCEHRVIMWEEKERYSMGLLSYNRKKVQTHEEMIDEKHPSRYKEFNHYEYINLRSKFPPQEEISNFILL